MMINCQAGGVGVVESWIQTQILVYSISQRSGYNVMVRKKNVSQRPGCNLVVRTKVSQRSGYNLVVRKKACGNVTVGGRAWNPLLMR